MSGRIAEVTVDPPSATTVVTMMMVVATGMSRMIIITVRMLLHRRFFSGCRRKIQRSAAQIQAVHFIQHAWQDAAMAHTRKSSENDSTRCDKDACADPIDPGPSVLRRQRTRSARHLTCSVSAELRPPRWLNKVTSNASSSARRLCFTLPTLPRGGCRAGIRASRT
jgi:hypothetical protein